MTPAALRDWVYAATGWRRRGLAFGAGALSVLALAPFFFSPILFLTLPVLIWLLDKPEDDNGWGLIVRAAAIGWWFGFGYFFFGLFWIGEAFLVEADKFAWLLPFAVTLMPAGLALFYAAATATAVAVSRRGWQRVLALALMLSIAEWLRGHILTGLPWNVLGYALTWPLPLMKTAGLVGIYGLTLWTILIFASPLVLSAERNGGWRSSLQFAVPPLLLLFLYGYTQLNLRPPAYDSVRFRIVQPNIIQREKWQPQNQRTIFEKHLELSRRNASGEHVGLAGITHIVWPEAAMPFLPLEHPEALAAINELTGDGAYLITGGLRRSPESPELAQPGAPQAMNYFNSLFVFGGGQQPAGIYDKIHLVPFGEYLPQQNLLEAIGLEALTRMRGGFTAGPVPRPLLSAGALKGIGPLICYEAIFPAAVVQGTERPLVLVNVTNDGWFGNTTGPRQHLHQTRVRAAEEGLPIVRAANNGISAVIDADGRVLASLDMNVEGVIDAALPGSRPPPPYARFGDALFALNLLIFALLFLYVRHRTRPDQT